MVNLNNSNNIWISALIVCFVLFVFGALVKSQSIKNVIFFLIALVLFVSMFELAKRISTRYTISKGFQKDCPSYAFLAVAGFVYIALVVIIYNLLGLGKKSGEGYRMLEINPVFKCVGGEYTWGAVDSPLYQFCSSPAVQAELLKINCGKGLVGRRANWNGQWAYTPQSNNEWRNTQCQCFKNGRSICNCLNRVNPNVGVL
jgi:hypothetical protein